MSNEEEIKEIERSLEELRETRKKVEESFSHVPDIKKQILMNLWAQERFLLELIEKKRTEG
ncbi:MAG TPA: hypothetical protein VNK81_03935 [Thermodesulfobacteriota bacterium]|nr:hypothetical protein [Thermodesulfobacteriota bacterium]